MRKFYPLRDIDEYYIQRHLQKMKNESLIYKRRCNSQKKLIKKFQVSVRNSMIKFHT